MKLIKSSYEIMSPVDGEQILKNIELAGRTCYKSEDKITEGSAHKLVKRLIDSKHESVLEHEKITVRFICDRGVSHELVRHRLASFSQESTRYCNYNKDKFGNELTFIIPADLDIKEGLYEYWDGDWCDIDNSIVMKEYKSDEIDTFLDALNRAELSYRILSNKGWSAQQARAVLPNALKTEIVVSANIREWRTIFKQRTAHTAHPDMRAIMCPLLDELKAKIPILFDDITYGNTEE